MGAHIELSGQAVEFVSGARCLGAHTSFTESLDHGSHIEERIKKAVTTIHRIQSLPLGFPARCRLLAAQPCLAVFYGCEVTQLRTHQEFSFARAVSACLWGKASTRRWMEVVFTVLSPGHRLDPSQAIPYRRLRSLLTVIQNREDLRGRIRTMQKLLPRSRRPMGPVGLAQNALELLGWGWIGGENWSVKATSGTFDLLSTKP